MSDHVTPGSAPAPFESWFDTRALDARLAGGEQPLTGYKQFLLQGRQLLQEKFSGSGSALVTGDHVGNLAHAIQDVDHECLTAG